MIELLDRGGIRCLALGSDSLPGGFDARDPRSLAEACGLLGIPLPRQAVQVHGTTIDRGEGWAECDAFLLGPGECALVRHADCVPVVVADPVRHAAALAHCGWRGAVDGLAELCVQALLEGGSRPGDLVAALGPCIGPSSFEVGEDVLARFPARHHARTSWGTPSADLPGLLRAQLVGRGVGTVAACGVDTFVDPAWHSHRRDPAHSGRNATICIVPREFRSIPPQTRREP